MPVEGAKPSAAARAAAAAWVARLHADDRTAEEERAFHAWISADPAHAAAFDMATQAYELAGALGDMPRTPLRKPVSRRVFFVGGGALAASVAAGAFILTRGKAYATEIGEQRQVALADGVEMLLDTDTRVVVARDGRIDLDRGQINLRLPSAPASPVEIEAPRGRVLAQAGAIDVRCEADALSVFVSDGSAAFITESETRALVAGDRLFASANGVVVDRPSANAQTAWHRALAVFESRTLSEAVAEMNRYSRTKLQVSDPALGALRLSGVYSVGDNVAFARSVALVLPVEARVSGDVIAFEPAPVGPQ